MAWNVMRYKFFFIVFSVSFVILFHLCDANNKKKEENQKKMEKNDNVALALHFSNNIHRNECTTECRMKIKQNSNITKQKTKNKTAFYSLFFEHENFH